MDNYNIFDCIPNSFFNNLASGSNQRMYSDCLLLIYDQYEREISYRIPRDQVRDALAIYLLEHHVSLDVEEGVEVTNHQDLANAILRRFCRKNVGWLEEERDDATFEKQILMTERGILLAEFLRRLQAPEREEYAGYIFQIFNTLQNPDQWQEHPYINGIRSVFRDAKDLSKSLKRLSTFIRKTIEKMIVEETLESLTRNLLEYFDGSFIREYSRLTKQQNIHIYRSSIRNRLDQIRLDQDMMDRLVMDCQKEEELSAVEAEDKIVDMIRMAKRFLLEDYDRIMRDIKHKINVYLQVAVGRARFLRSQDVDEKGNVERVVKYIAQEMDELGLKEDIPSQLQALFAFEKHEFIDTSSIRYPRKTKIIRRETVTELEELTEEDIRLAKEEQEREAYNPYSKNRMKAFMDHSMGERRYMVSEELPVHGKEDMLSVLSAVAYGEENGFEIRPLEGYVESEGMLIRRFEVTRKKL